MTKILLSLMVLSLIAAGCERVELKREVPTSPVESYQPIPK